VKTDMLSGSGPGAIAAEAARAEALGLSGFMVPETRHDAFVSLALAASSTASIDIGTSVAIAFARTPMTTAISAYDIQRLSGGRTVLGLGSQIRPHITHRYGMPWSRPAARMREFVGAMRAIWASWENGTRLDFRGDFYTHTLMTPMFDPGPVPGGPPRVLVAAVGERMTRVAAEVADGLICHPLSTPDYLRDRIAPVVEEARPAERGEADGFEFAGMVMVATGRTEPAMHEAIRRTREQIAFYASTPAYLPILEHHGWGPLQGELNALSKRGAWSEMADLISDDILDAIAVVGPPDEVGAAVARRFGGLLGRVSLSLPYQAGAELAETVLSGVRDAAARHHDDSADTTGRAR
jgi:probable F420-dependent oxidoreductase